MENNSFIFYSVIISNLVNCKPALVNAVFLSNFYEKQQKIVKTLRKNFGTVKNRHMHNKSINVCFRYYLKLTFFVALLIALCHQVKTQKHNNML